MMLTPSTLINEAIDEISKLPGIGKKTALRLVLHLLKRPKANTLLLSESLSSMRERIKYCKICGNISELDCCEICTDKKRDDTIICIVNDFPDIISIENTMQYHGLYHVLGGIISPLQGIGPENLSIDSLISRFENPDNPIKEVIFALSSTMDGDTTAFYIANQIKHLGVKITTLARGIPVGEELEYTDEITLGRSIKSRKSF